MANLTQGWQAYHGGNYQEALQHFEGGDSNHLTGRALTLLAMGRGDEAATLVEQQLRSSHSSDLEALIADIKGRQGQRKQAQQVLAGTTSRNKNVGFYRSLLGEQRIRLGKWDDGTNDFIAALNMRDERTFPHVRRVIADMVDAVAARRIPRQDAMKFINRIDYSASDKTDAMNSFFATGRRALNGNRRMERGELTEAWAADVPGGSQRAQSGSAAKPSNSAHPSNSRPPRRTNRSPSNARSDGSSKSRPSNQAPTSQNQRRRTQSKSSPQSNKRSRPSRSTQADGPSQRREKNRKTRQRLQQRPQQVQLSSESGMQAKQKDMTAVLQEEREQNECLQDLVAEVHPPEWPSLHPRPIDNIKAIGFSKDSILQGSSDIETANFRITGGDIRVEITLERCMHNLIAAALATKPTTLPLIPESIPRLELNLLDDFIKDMPRLDELYLDETEAENEVALGIGKFIGECVVQSYGGVWNHDIPARDSVIHLGDRVLDPIGMAEDFLSADDFETVQLRDIIAEAQEGIATSTSFPTFTNYIDPTSGLENEALATNLAELWVGYRFMMADIKVAEIANSLEIIDNFPQFVIFSMTARYAPSAIVDDVDGAKSDAGKTGMAYLRETGEFLVLASRKHFCRLLEGADISLNRDVGPSVAALLQHGFRPGWKVLVDRETTDKWNQEYDTTDLKRPALRKKDGKVTLRLHAIDAQNNIRKIQLQYDSASKRPYSLATS